jgi:hypothetical protein
MLLSMDTLADELNAGRFLPDKGSGGAVALTKDVNITSFSAGLSTRVVYSGCLLWLSTRVVYLCFLLCLLCLLGLSSTRVVTRLVTWTILNVIS